MHRRDGRGRAVLALCGLSLALAAAPAAAAAKSSVAVLQFQNKTLTPNNQYWSAQPGFDLGWGMAEMLATELVKTGKFRVVERARLEDVLREQDLGQSGRVAPGTEARLGSVLGARYLIYGAVTELNVVEKGGSARVRIRGVGIGGATSHGTVAVDVRVVDTTSGEVVESYTARGAATNTRLDADYRGAEVSTGGEAFWASSLGRATREAIEKTAKRLEKSVPEREDPRPAWSGAIEVAEDGSLVVLGGSREGLAPGTELHVLRPRTKTVAGRELVVGQDRVGRVRLRSVAAEASEAELLEGERPRSGDTVSTAEP